MISVVADPSSTGHTTLRSLATKASRSRKGGLRSSHGLPGKGGQGGRRRSTGTGLRVGRDERNAKSLDHTSRSGRGSARGTNSTGSACRTALLANTGVGDNVRSHLANIHNVRLAFVGGPVGENGLVAGGEVARADERVGDAVTAQSRLAGRLVGAGDSKDLARVRLGGSVDLGKDITLDQDVGVLANIKSMAAVVEPVVVVGVPVVGELDLGRTAGGVVDVVVGEGHLVVFSIAETIGNTVSGECLSHRDGILTRSSSGGHRKRQTSWCGRRIRY